MNAPIIPRGDYAQLHPIELSSPYGPQAPGYISESLMIKLRVNWWGLEMERRNQPIGMGRTWSVLGLMTDFVGALHVA